MRTAHLIFLMLFSLCAFAVEPGVPEEARAALDRGNHEYANGKYQDASKDFAEAIRLTHDHCQACVEGLALVKGRTGEQKESFKLADRALAMAEAPIDKASAHDCKGELCLMYAGGDPKKLAEAENEFRAGAELLPNNAAMQFRLGYVLLREKKNDEGVQHLQAFLASHPAGPNADLARKYIANPRLAGAAQAPKFSVTTLQGATIDNAQLEGKVVVFDFWATWCPACRASLPDMRELTKKYGPDKVRVVSVSADKNDAQWRDFVGKKHMDWDQYRDAEGAVLKAFGIRVFPSYVIVDQDGLIVRRMEGEDPQESLVHRLRQELGEMVK